MSEAVGEVLALGIGVALTPSAVIAAVLLLAGPGGRKGAAVLVATWTMSLAIVATVALVLADGAGAGDGGQRAAWVAVLQVILAVALVVLAVRQGQGRLTGGAASEMPRWMQKVDGLSTAKAAGTAIFLAVVKPKNLLLTIAAAVAIAGLNAPAATQAGALLVFLALAAMAPAAPLLLSIAMRERSPATLQRVREWMVRENATIVAVICLVFAAKLIGDALGA